VEIFRKGKQLKHTTDSKRDDPIAATALPGTSPRWRLTLKALNSPAATSARRMLIECRQRLQTLVDEGRPYEIDPVNPSTESDQAQR
jgi:hypothetical protein